MKLNYTIELMENSVKDEFHKLERRHKELKDMLEKWDKGELDFTPPYERSIYETEFKMLEQYLPVLKARAEAAEIEL